MLKNLLLLILFNLVLFAQDKVEIYATSIKTKDNIVKVFNGINVVYRNYYLSANNAIYDKLSGDLELFGDVRVSNGVEFKILGEKAKLNLATKKKSFEPFFLIDEESEVWISAKKANSDDVTLDISSGIISGCNPVKPLWKMEFDSSSYNVDTKWLNIYNAKLYIYDIPVLYTPYFGRSISKERRTGILTPSLGLSSTEGFYFEQPIYIAEQNWWDLELKPQIRTSRGVGIYSKFRFIDSEVANGKISLGYFKEKDNFYISQSLANKRHYGYNIEYEHNDIIDSLFKSNLNGETGLFLDIKSMNDIDYINLSENDSSKNATATQLLSRINLFYNDENNYLGSYLKYYKDLTLDTNKNTLQILPAIQYHQYIDTFLDNYFLYSVDIESKNIQREINIKAIQTDLNVPITFYKSIFDEYLNVSYTSYLYGQYTKFSGYEKKSTGKYNNGLFTRQYNMVGLSTELLKSYEKYTHTISFNAKYTLSGLEIDSGYYEDVGEYCASKNKNDPRCEFYNITDVDEALELEFRQYLFNQNSKQILYNRISQTLSSKNSELGELENELDFKIYDDVNIYSNIFYNYDEDKISKLFHSIHYKGEHLNLDFSHLYENRYSNISSYLTSKFRYIYDIHYSYNLMMNYDLKTHLKKSSEIGFLYKKRCWDFGLKYVENNRPILTKDNSSSSVYDRYIYFTIILKPFMTYRGKSSDFDMKLPDILSGDK